MRTTRASRLALVGAGLAAALVASACSSSTSPSTTPSKTAALTKITVGTVPIVDAAPFFLGLKEGFFKQEGLDVTPDVFPQSTLALPALLRGSVQFVTAANTASWIKADASGTAKLTEVAPNSTCTASSEAILAMPGSGIKTAADLAHKTIAVNINPNIQTLQTNADLKADNVNTSTVTYVPITFGLMPAALAAHRVDAINEVEPFITATEEKYGAVPVMQLCAGPTADIQLGGNFATSAYATSHRSVVLAFQKAMEKANALADADRTAVEQIIPTYIKTVTPKEAALINLDAWGTTQDTTQLQRIADLMLSGKMLSSPFNVGPMMYPQGG
jgi:NitT/TauT family transport system substrate-binding protein